MANQSFAQDVEQQTAAQSVERVENDIFAQLMGEGASEELNREDVIKKLLASGKAKRVNGLNVRNVVATNYESDGNIHTLLTFVVKEFVIGDVRDTEQTDAYSQPLVKLGKTHNVQSSNYAVAGVMKDNPKLAIFASDVVDDPTLANMLFAGAKIDVIMQYVPAHTEYVNPFASNPKPTEFDRDKMIHHIVALSMGEVGQDMYRERLRR